MALALSHPLHGYYMHARSRSAQRAISSPRRRSARCSANWSGFGAARSGAAMGAPPRVRLVELGPGRGALMADAAARGGGLAWIFSPRSTSISSRPAPPCARYRPARSPRRRRRSSGAAISPKFRAGRVLRRQRVLRRAAGAAFRAQRARLARAADRLRPERRTDFRTCAADRNFAQGRCARGRSDRAQRRRAASH